MVSQTRSTAKSRNDKFVAMPREGDEGNLAWGERAALRMANDAGPVAWTYIVLLGGSDTLSFRLRVAQSHLRRDMLPSYWSEAILVKLSGPTLKGARALYVPLAQPGGIAYPPNENGVVETPLTDFDDPHLYPNIALIALPIPQEQSILRLESFRRARSSLDTLEHVLRWLAFAWGVARTGNPLHENYGLPSACMLEMICAAEDFDLTPGLESRSSCPEAIWASTIHWHEYFKKTGQHKVPFGRFAITHGYPIVEPDSGQEGTKPGRSRRNPARRKGSK